ncbi:hypothetical protein HDU93_008520, partial [Gonapodya sp. JEL0774]
MPTFGDFTAHVIVDGNPLPEYGVQVSTDPTTGQPRITAYVESKTDQEFAVKVDGINRNPHVHSLSTFLHLDGVPINGILDSSSVVKVKIVGKPVAGGYQAM